MKRTAVALAIVAMALSLPARAGFYTGQELHEFCSAPDGSQKATMCIGYIAGAASAYSGLAFCPPNGIKLGQVVDVVKKALAEHPAVRDKNADVLLLRLFEAWFPCKEQPATQTPQQRNPRGGDWS